MVPHLLKYNHMDKFMKHPENPASPTRSIWSVLTDELGKNFVEDAVLHRDIRALSSAFTENRSKLTQNYMSKPHLARAYLAYFLPLNFLKTDLILSELEPPTTLKQRWIDFGCGPATASLAALSRAKEGSQISIDLIDSNEAALDIAIRLLENMALKKNILLTLETAARLNKSHDQYDLALASNVLNELPEHSGPSKEPFVDLWDRTRGNLVIIEPSHRVASQRLIRLRARLLTQPQTHIVGPCLHAEKCPLFRTQHWCHFSEQHADGRMIDLNLRVFKDPRAWLKFSYLSVSRSPRTEEPMRSLIEGSEIFRSIGDVHPSSGRLAIDLCQPSEKLVLKLPRNLPPLLQRKLLRGRLVEVGPQFELNVGSSFKSLQLDSDKSERNRPRVVSVVTSDRKKRLAGPPRRGTSVKGRNKKNEP